MEHADATEAVVKIDRIAALTAEAVLEASAIGSPRRRSARLCASPAPDYNNSPVPTKRRRSTSSTSSMAEDSKPVVQKICLRKKVPEKIDEEEEKAGGQTEARTARSRRESSQSVDTDSTTSSSTTTTRSTRTRRTSQLFELQKVDESSPARSTRSRRSSQNFEVLNDAASTAEPSTRSRSRRSSQNFEDVPGKATTTSKKLIEETINEEPETSEIDREKSEVQHASIEGKPEVTTGSESAASSTASDLTAETDADAKSVAEPAAKDEEVIDVITIDDDDEAASEPPNPVDGSASFETDKIVAPIDTSPKSTEGPVAVQNDSPKKQLKIAGSPMKSPKLVQENVAEKTESPKKSARVSETEKVSVDESVLPEAAEVSPDAPPSVSSPTKKVVKPTEQISTSPKKSTVFLENSDASEETSKPEPAAVPGGTKSPVKAASVQDSADGFEVIEVEKISPEVTQVTEVTEQQVEPSKQEEKAEALSSAVAQSTEAATVVDEEMAPAVEMGAEAPEPMDVDDDKESAADDLAPKSAEKVSEKENSEPEPKIVESSESDIQKLSRPISRKFWKSDRDRFRSVIKSKGLKQNLKQRAEQKASMLRARELEKALKEEGQRQREELKARQEANKKKREENARKTEVVQLVKNPAKLKRMKKKQLRQLEKRDVTVVQKK